MPSSFVTTKSLEELEKELENLKSAEKAAADAGMYAEAQAFRARHDTKTHELNEYKKLKSQEQTDTADTEIQGLIAQIQAAANRLGLQVREAVDQVKYDAKELVMGLPPDAGRGIGPFLNYPGGTQALYTQVGRGLDAINEEIDRNGSEVDKECRDYILYQEAGNSDRTFQQLWKRDCDPKTGEVLPCRQVDADCELYDADGTPRTKRGMIFSDFVNCEIAQFCELTEAEVFALVSHITFKSHNHFHVCAKYA